MSSADGWDLTVPEDEAELVAELRRHGWLPGRRFHIVQTPDEQTRDATEPEAHQAARRRLGFVASIQGGPSDLSERTDEYLQRGFGRE